VGSKEVLCEDTDGIHLAQDNVHGNRLSCSIKGGKIVAVNEIHLLRRRNGLYPDM
jgi:hypothetical protein